jgi:hypothetical protein
LNIACKLLFNAQLINSTLSNRSVAMQPNKTKLALKIGAVVLGALCASGASADPFTASVTTIDDVSITPKTALDFGTIVFTTAGNCIMNSAAPGKTLMEYTNPSDTALPAAGYGATTGSSCVSVAGSDTTVTPGVWRISGTAGGAVSILITTLAQASADYTYVPDGGCYIDFDGTTTTTLDVCSPLVPGTVVAGALLADITANETDGSISDGTAATAGDLLFTIGGTLNIVNPLVAETNYPLTFQVDVTY